MGYEAGETITTGSNNVCIGYQADTLTAAADNQIVIGQGVTGTGDNQIALGNASITAIKAEVNSITAYSDERIKKDVQNSTLGLEFIQNLRPVTYKKVNPADYPEPLLEKRFQGDEPEDRPEDDDKRYDGLIAQEVEQTLINMGEAWSGHSVNESDGKHGIQYGALVVPLIKAVQELKTDNDALKARVEALENN